MPTFDSFLFFFEEKGLCGVVLLKVKLLFVIVVALDDKPYSCATAKSRWLLCIQERERKRIVWVGLTRLDPAEGHVYQHVGARPAHPSTAVDQQWRPLVAGRLVHLPVSVEQQTHTHTEQS